MKIHVAQEIERDTTMGPRRAAELRHRSTKNCDDSELNESITVVDRLHKRAKDIERWLRKHCYEETIVN